MKYILKKEYPGSPKLGTIHKYEGNVWSDSNEFTSPILNPEKYPEFWEPVVELDYEILSLICDIPSKTIITYENGGGRSYKVGEFEKVYKSKGKWLYSFTVLNPNIWKIHSIKRLSDGEIFTIGDKVVGYNNSIAKIKTIDLVGEISLNIGTDKHEGFSLKNLKKIKQPLFTTEDGVDIFEGDLFYYVKFVQYNNTLGKPFEIVRGDHPSFEYEPQYEKYFSTKEKAEEYILMNKPCLSLKDVASIYISADKPITDTTSYSAQNRRIQELVKLKIQQSV